MFITDEMTQRCLDEITMMSARIALADRDAVRVPYICQVSGRAKELLLISRRAAERMVVATKGVINIDEARTLALLHISHLCETDIADLLHVSQPRAKAMLNALAKRGLASLHMFEDVSYYKQNDGDVHTQFQDLALGAFNA
jgi:hypothetical protein